LWSEVLEDAHDTNFADFSTGYARRAGSDLHRDARFDRAIIDLPALTFNGVFRSRLPVGDVAPVAEETVALASARRVPVAWRITPTTPPTTGPALEALGWVLAWHEPIMVVDLGATARPDPPPGVTVEEVDGAALADWSRVVAMAFGCPEEYVSGPAAYDRDVGLPGETPLRRFLARSDGEPVAASAFLPGPPTSRLAGIFSVGTLEYARGRGLGGLITSAAMHAAHAAGARVAVLQASDQGVPVYQRLGFDLVDHMAVFCPPG
jgi:hypothetical protein